MIAVSGFSGGVRSGTGSGLGPGRGRTPSGAFPQVRARAPGGLAIEPRGEEDLPRQGVEQDLLRIVGMRQARPGGAGTVDPVGVVPRLADRRRPAGSATGPTSCSRRGSMSRRRRWGGPGRPRRRGGAAPARRAGSRARSSRPAAPRPRTPRGGWGFPQDRGPGRPRLPRPRPYPVDRPIPALGRGEPVRPAVRRFGGHLGGRRPVLPWRRTPGGPPMGRDSGSRAARPATGRSGSPGSG